MVMKKKDLWKSWKIMKHLCMSLLYHDFDRQTEQESHILGNLHQKITLSKNIIYLKITINFLTLLSFCNSAIKYSFRNDLN